MKDNLAENLANLESCDKEPIHIPGATQRYGVLLVVAPESYRILQVAETCVEILNKEPKELLGKSLGYLIGEERLAELDEEMKHEELPLSNPFLNNINPLGFTIKVDGKKKPFSGTVHKSPAGIILELEESDKEENLSFPHFYELSRQSLLNFQGAKTIEDLAHIAAREVKELTGFDRVMVYKFDEEWNGDVIAESRNSYAPGYIGLHYPASDIPLQARRLYLRNWLRYIPDTTYKPASLLSEAGAGGEPLDMSNTMLRSVSPIHIEYLYNMGVKATLTISLIKDGELWGLIACHHLSERTIPYHIRVAAEYIGQILSLQLNLKEKSDTQITENRLRSIHASILESVSRQQDFMLGMKRVQTELLQLTDSTGVIIVSEDDIMTFGPVPGKDDIDNLVSAVKGRLDDENYLYYTNHLSKILPGAENYKEVASGLMAFMITKSTATYVIWLRPEVIQQINWGGKPDKFEIREEDGKVRLHPRKSFEKWQQEVELKSAPWGVNSLHFANELRNALKDYFLFKGEQIRKEYDSLEVVTNQLKEEVKERGSTQQKLEHYMNELKRSNKELEQFAYITSHDLQEPLRATSSFSKLLEKRYGDQLDERGRKYIRFIVDGTERQQQLIEDILEFSRSGSRQVELVDCDLCNMLDRIKFDMAGRIHECDAEISCEVPFLIKADKVLLSQLIQNLVSNAIKYRKEGECPDIRVSGTEKSDYWQLSVSDNGIGIEKEYFDKVFVIFRRLHTAQEYPGTGVGLSICKRIVEKHGGRIWIESEPGKGTTFNFTIAKKL
ncbi:MAG: ATP-binding protein [Cyclobacteriaceae bacterium]